MRSMDNSHEGRVAGLKEKVLCTVADKLVEIAVSPRGNCWAGILYESTLSPEIINRLIEKDI